AAQNGLMAGDAEVLCANGVTRLSEGANMPTTNDAIERSLESGIAYGPGKAANAGGVATSQLEMQQNAGMTQWSRNKVDTALREIMSDIFVRCRDTAKEFEQPANLVMGANIAGFRRVADAMIA